MDGRRGAGRVRPPRTAARREPPGGRSEGTAGGVRGRTGPTAGRRRGPQAVRRTPRAGPGGSVSDGRPHRASRVRTGEPHPAVVRSKVGPADRDRGGRLQQAAAAGRATDPPGPRGASGGVSGRTAGRPRRGAGRVGLGRPLGRGPGRRNVAGRSGRGRHRLRGRTRPARRFSFPAAHLHHEPCGRGRASEGRADAGPAFDHHPDDGPVHARRPGEGRRGGPGAHRAGRADRPPRGRGGRADGRQAEAAKAVRDSEDEPRRSGPHGRGEPGGTAKGRKRGSPHGSPRGAGSGGTGRCGAVDREGGERPPEPRRDRRRNPTRNDPA